MWANSTYTLLLCHYKEVLHQMLSWMPTRVSKQEWLVYFKKKKNKQENFLTKIKVLVVQTLI